MLSLRPNGRRTDALLPLLGALAVIAEPAHLAAQKASPVVADTLSSEAAAVRAPRGDGSLILGGLTGGAAGFVLGAFAGAAVAGSDPECRDWCEFGGVVIGGALGEVLGLATGVHLANRSSGSWWRTVGVATASGVLVGAAGGLVAPGSGGEWLIMIPVTQLVGAIKVQRATED